MSDRLAPLAYTIPDAAAASGVSDKTLRRAIAKGDLPVRYPTARPVVLADDLHAWLANTPTEPPTPT